ncbi:MAG: hypothetical protein GX443_10685 [Deltaproteobacteria bacterium]|nr:hypothetical protein [Deltaproteobacteria bacterium]
MWKTLFSVYFFFVVAVAAAAPLARGENLTGRWEASYFLNRIVVDVVNEGETLQGVLYLYPLGGETSTYHFKGTISRGKLEARHHSGHSFRGTVRRNQVQGVLTTKTGMRVPLHLDDLRPVP